MRAGPDGSATGGAPSWGRHAGHNRTPLTDAERRRRDRERMEAAARELLDSDGWRRWVRTRARFHSYSLGNTLLIAHQRPDATRVAGFRAWLALNRCVRKGEKAIYIWAPMRVKEREPATGQETGERRTLFRLAPVFDTLSRDRLGGFSRDAVARLKTLDRRDAGIARRRR